MKQFSKRIVTLLLAASLTASMAACKPTNNVPPFELTGTVPAEVSIGAELDLSEYITEEESATYNIYVSYTDPDSGETVTDQKLSSMIFVCEKATVYTLKFERVLNGTTTSVTKSVETLPMAPAFAGAMDVYADVNETLTFEELITNSQIQVSPGDLRDDIQVVSAEIEKRTFSSDATELSELTSTVEFTNETSYQFTDEGIYVFNLVATNKSGTANGKITVNVESDVAAAREKASTTISFNETTKTVSWTAVDGATGYALYLDGVKQTVGNVTEYTFTSLETGTYKASVYPVYDTTIYAKSVAKKNLYVGAVQDALELTRKVYTVSWELRDAAIGYTVKENATTTELNATQNSYTLKGSYAIGEKITLEVVTNYAGSEKSNAATLDIFYGTVTLDSMDIDNPDMANQYKATTGIQFIEFDRPSQENGNTFFLIEFTGKNMPNFAFGAKYGLSELYAGHTTTHDWTDAGILVMSSNIDGKFGYMGVQRGFCSKAGALDAISVSLENGSSAPGLMKFKDDVHYIMIVGIEQLTFNNTDPNRKFATEVSYWLFTEENGTLALESHKSVIAQMTSHVMVENHSANPLVHNPKVVIYPAVKGTFENNPTPDAITFTYYNPASTLLGVLDNCTKAEYKTQLQTLVNAELNK